MPYDIEKRRIGTREGRGYSIYGKKNLQKKKKQS